MAAQAIPSRRLREVIPVVRLDQLDERFLRWQEEGVHLVPCQDPKKVHEEG